MAVKLPTPIRWVLRRREIMWVGSSPQLGSSYRRKRDQTTLTGAAPSTRLREWGPPRFRRSTGLSSVGVFRPPGKPWNSALGESYCHTTAKSAETPGTPQLASSLGNCGVTSSAAVEGSAYDWRKVSYAALVGKAAALGPQRTTRADDRHHTPQSAQSPGTPHIGRMVRTSGLSVLN